MMKTPIQIAIEKIEFQINNSFAPGELGLKKAKKILTELLPTEKEVIKDAFDSGVNEDFNATIEYRATIEGCEYFTQTFKVNQ